jgi:hypothetical protein
MEAWKKEEGMLERGLSRRRKIIILLLILSLGTFFDYLLTGMGADWNVEKLLEREENVEVKECVSKFISSYSDFISITLCFKLKLKLLLFLLAYISIFAMPLWILLLLLKSSNVTQRVLFFAQFGAFILFLEQVMAGLTWHFEWAKFFYVCLVMFRFPIFIIIFIWAILKGKTIAKSARA